MRHDDAVLEMTVNDHAATLTRSLPMGPQSPNCGLIEAGSVRRRPLVADITYVPTQAGWLYLAAVEDLYSRQVVGWSMSERIDSRLVVDAPKDDFRHGSQHLTNEQRASYADAGLRAALAFESM